MIQELQRIVERGTPWKHYQHTVEIYKEAEMFNAKSSQEQRKEITRYRPSEDYDMKDQRIEVSNPVTGAALSPSYAVYSSLSRVQPAVSIDFQDRAKGDAIKENMSVFYARKPVQEYVFNQVLSANKYDPNRWLVIESEPIISRNGTVAGQREYPVVYECEKVYDVAVDKAGVATSLTIREIKTAPSKENYSEWRYYAAGIITHAVEAHKGMQEMPDYTPVIWTVDRKEKVYYVREYPNTTTQLPAARLGAYMTPEGDYCVTLFDEAIPQLHELIKTGNLGDVTEILHAFPKLFEYVKKCDAQNEQDMYCDGGWYGGVRDKEHRCYSCNGSGVVRAASEQSVIQLQYPETQDGFFDLSKLIYWATMPLDLLNRLDEREQMLSAGIYLTIFNQDLTPRNKVGPDTATATVINHEAQYNKVAPFTETIEDVCEMVWMAAAGWWDTPIDVEYKYPPDLKFQSFAELVANYDAAAKAGLDTSIIDHVRDQILMRMYENQPGMYQEAKAIEAWKPFSGKSSEEIAFILSLRDLTDPDRVLWENYDAIQREILASEGGNFHRKTYEAQRGIIEGWVQIYQTRAKYLDMGAGGAI
jgi:hypothetical protein